MLKLVLQWSKDSYLFVNGKEIVKFKAKDSEIVACPLCLGSISKDWSTVNMKKTGLNGYVYEFSVEYNDFDKVDPGEAIPFLHNYLIARTTETRHIKWHETCKCKCRLDASVCHNKQRWINDKCKCECK